jgi:hypothetical protein
MPGLNEWQRWIIWSSRGESSLNSERQSPSQDTAPQSHRLRSWLGSCRRRLPEVRAEIVRRLVENYGMPIANVARQVGISTSGASNHPDKRFVQLVNSVPDLPPKTFSTGVFRQSVKA